MTVAGALLEIAAAIRDHAHQGLCCSDHTIVEMRDGRTYWRRHEWLAGAWAPLGLPGGEDAPVSKPARPRVKPKHRGSR